MTGRMEEGGRGDEVEDGAGGGWVRCSEYALTILAVLGSLVMAMMGQRGRNFASRKAVLEAHKQHRDMAVMIGAMTGLGVVHCQRSRLNNDVWCRY